MTAVRAALALALLVVLAHISSAQTVLTTIPTGAIPTAIAVNPVTNKTYVANRGANSVTVIDGATNTTATVKVGSIPKAIAVNPITNKIYVANGAGGSVTVIDGPTNTTSTVTVGTTPDAIAINPVTNKIYVTNAGSSNVTVIDGATNGATAITTSDHPYAIALNTVTNKIYVTHYSTPVSRNTVTVIDGATNAATDITVGTNPDSIAVNEITNKIYVANLGGGVTVIDGATNAAAAVSAGTYPYAVAVNPVTNKIYVANEASANVTVVDGATDTTATVTVGTDPQALTVNLLTNQVYVANYGSNNVSVIDGATNSTTPQDVGTSPSAVAVNPVTNLAYFANSGSANVSLVNGATNQTANVAVGSDPASVAVNPATNKIYVINCGNGGYCGSDIKGTVSVIDGATNTASTVNVGPGPTLLVVNPVTNKIYVLNENDGNEIGSVTVIDGATNNTTSVNVGYYPNAIDLNPVTNKIYVANVCGDIPYPTCSANGTVTVIDGSTNNTTTLEMQIEPGSVAVDPATNKVYVASLQYGSSSGSLAVIDGATNLITTSQPPTSRPLGPLAIDVLRNKIFVEGEGVNVFDGATATFTAVIPVTYSGLLAFNPIIDKGYTVSTPDGGSVSVFNPATDKSIGIEGIAQHACATAINTANNQAYIADAAGSAITIIDGITNFAFELPTGAYPDGVAVNTSTNAVFVANHGNVSTITPNTPQDVPIAVAVQGVSDSQTITGDAIFATKNTSPSFTAMVTSSFSPSAPASTALFYQLDTASGAWQSATSTGGSGSNPATYSFQLPTLQFGVHTVYVYAECGGEFSNVGTYMFVVVGTPTVPAAITSPTPGSTLLGSTATFTWTTGTAVSQYSLYIGTTKGAHDIDYINAGTNTSTTVTNLPSNATPIYVTLYSLINGAWQGASYTYTAAGTPTPATMTSPTPGSTLSGSSATFTWTTGVGVTNYSLYIGTTEGAHDVAFVNAGTNTSQTVASLPTNGGTLFVRLYSLIAGAYQYHDYTYLEAGTSAKATMVSPTNGSTLHGASATFTWTTGTGVTSYSLYVGTTRGNDDLDYVPTTATSATIKNLPAIGSTVYVRLYSYIAGAWQYADYSYTSSP